MASATPIINPLLSVLFTTLSKPSKYLDDETKGCKEEKVSWQSNEEKDSGLLPFPLH